MQATRDMDSTPSDDVVAVALELSGKSWKCALQDGKRSKPAIYTAEAGCAAERLRQAVTAIEAIKAKWGWPAQVRVVVMYEAGQDGFWIARALTGQGYEAMVVDPASIPVERHARRAKTDRLDAIKLVCCLRAWLRGERDRMRMVRIPAPEAEAQRHLARERGQLQKEVGQHRDRIRKLLRTAGCWDSVGADFAGRLRRGEILGVDGSALPRELHERLDRECERLALVSEQLAALERKLVAQLQPAARARVKDLVKLRGIGNVGALRLMLELFWRDFDSRRQVGASAGLVPQPYDSGQSRVDQGISKQGNGRVRALLIELAWDWTRYQPDSAITRWYLQRISGNPANKRGKRITIVAVARRLAIVLWRYLKDGVIPDGARFKPA